MPESTPAGRLDQDVFLSAFCAVLREMGYEASLAEPKGGPVFAVIRMEKLGEIEHTCEMSLCFLPASPENDADPESRDFDMLQFYTAVFSGVPLDHISEIDSACSICTRYSPIGAFGTQPELGLLYCRYGLPLRGRYGMETCLRLTADVFAHLLGSIYAQIDGLALVARGMMTVPEAQAAGRLPKTAIQ